MYKRVVSDEKYYYIIYLSVNARLTSMETHFLQFVSCLAIFGPMVFNRRPKSSQEIREKFLNPLRGSILKSSSPLRLL